MKSILELDPKQADAYKGSTLKSIDKSIEILDYELHKLSIIKREMIASGKDVFIPTDYGIEEHIPHII